MEHLIIPASMSTVIGAGESGKSTFIKQMRIIYGSGFTEQDREREFTRVVFHNVYMAVQDLAKGMETTATNYHGDGPRQLANLIRHFDYYQLKDLGGPDRVAQIAQFWRDEGVRRCYERRNEFQLSDSAGYFLSSLDRIAAPGFIPTVEDVLRVRVPTSGIHEYCFDMKGKQSMKNVCKVILICYERLCFSCSNRQ